MGSSQRTVAYESAISVVVLIIEFGTGSLDLIETIATIMSASKRGSTQASCPPSNFGFGFVDINVVVSPGDLNLILGFFMTTSDQSMDPAFQFVHQSPVRTEEPANVPVIDDRYIPKSPKTLEEAGLHQNDVFPVILKYLLLHGVQPGRQVAQQMKLPFQLICPLLESLKTDLLIGRKAVHGVADYEYELTPKGVDQAKIALKRTTYCGSAAVTVEDYRKAVKVQSIRNYRPTLQDVSAALSDLTVSKLMITQLGQAVISGRSLFLFGQPGNGKTSIARRVIKSVNEHIWIPRALTIGGEVIRLFDPIVHQQIPLNQDKSNANLDVDHRWVRIKRPTIVVGGELTLSSLEAAYNSITGILEAPIHIKSNCGCLVVDDFGRQQVSVTELLNRWIVPMESAVDYLVLPSGRQVNLPFEQLLVFSTNLEPSKLCDEAFLRRIPYKIEVFDPTEHQFRNLFAEVAGKMDFEVKEGVLDDIIEYHFKRVSRPFRFCHPQDLLQQAKDFCEFHRRPFVLTRDIAELAVLNYFSGMPSNIGVK